MTYVDKALLDLTEWLCRRFQMWTGRTNVWLAFHLTNLSIVVYFVWAGVLYWQTGVLAVRLFVGLFCGALFVMLTRTLFRTSIESADAQAYQRVAKGLRNPRRVRDAQLRISFFTLSIVLVIGLWFADTIQQVPRFMFYAEGLVVLTTAVLYVLACDPLPPSAKKVWSWLPVTRLSFPSRPGAAEERRATSRGGPVQTRDRR
jgi:hypothetical protein